MCSRGCLTHQPTQSRQVFDMTTSRIFTDIEAFEYLERIKYPFQRPHFPPATIDTLRRLMSCHLSAIPCGNVSHRYSRSPSPITTDSAYLFRTIVNEKKTGGCTELNGLCGILLKTLGYGVYSVGARVWIKHSYHKSMSPTSSRSTTFSIS
jgi:arylamine N-acetyltransferase